GDTVGKGDVLAVLESADLGEAKTQYVGKLNELSCCAIELTRAEALQESTRKLLTLLDTSPTLEELRTAEFTDLSEDHGKLVAAYAELVFARAAHERESKLLDQGISSRADFQTAESAYKKAYAGYVATRSSVAFETRRAMLDARRRRQNGELEVKAAGRKLHVLGLTGHDVEHLQEALTGERPAGGKECSDPNCPDCRAAKAPGADTDAHGLDEQLGLYSLRAPFDGTIIRKHIALGEMLADDADVFLIADMSTVWVDLSVYQKDLPYVRRGQTVHITVGPGAPHVEGKISFVSPIVDETTRTCPARVVLPNPNGALRPGLFVTAEVAVDESDARVLLPKDAVRRIGDESVVFVPTSEGLAPKPVRLGGSSRTHVEIVSGLDAGEKYVAQGTFELKAKIVTSGLGAHAGHGH
ncbi:MAG: efflux RND transporter periplasmic adaptor subunit, partial [Phycisphaerae bacterium]